MARKLDVTIYCANSRGRYLETFEEQEPNKWYGVAETRLPDVGLFEKRGNAPAKPEKKPGIFEMFKSKLTSAPEPKREPSLSITGEIFLGTHKCPCCGNDGFVKCGCGAMTCMPAESKKFKCAVCGVSGTIDHYMSDLSGDMNEGGGNRKNNTLG